MELALASCNLYTAKESFSSGTISYQLLPTGGVCGLVVAAIVIVSGVVVIAVMVFLLLFLLCCYSVKRMILFG